MIASDQLLSLMVQPFYISPPNRWIQSENCFMQSWKTRTGVNGNTCRLCMKIFIADIWINIRVNIASRRKSCVPDRFRSSETVSIFWMRSPILERPRKTSRMGHRWFPPCNTDSLDIFAWNLNYIIYCSTCNGYVNCVATDEARHRTKISPEWTDIDYWDD